MATELFEDTVDLTVEILETEPIAPGPSYPMPRLRRTGSSAARTFQTAILENLYLRVTLAPSLGGRLVSLFDKRTGTEILPQETIFTSEGRRGVALRTGMVLRLDGEDRLNALGSVSTMLQESEDPESPGSILIAETSLANGLSFHLRFFLASDRAELILEGRISNRTLQPKPYDGELAFFVGEGTWDGATFYSPGRSAGFALFSEELFEGARHENGVLRFARFGEPRLLSGRQVDTWTVRLAPLSGLGAEPVATPHGAISIDAEQTRIQTTAKRMGHKLVILTEDGRTLEAPVDIYPEHVLEIPHQNLGASPNAIVLLDPAREEILKVPPPLKEKRVGLLRETFDPGTRYLAYTRLGIDALRERDFAKADERFEQALMYNADDPLLWWEKALLRRLAEPDNENAELLNAHYLAPLEPALRAEAFLAQPLDLGRDPSPLLASLEENPEEFIEVACLHIEHGQLDQASRWIDEALRHQDLAMLRILMAFCLLKGTQMVTEAAEHLAAANRVPGPPYPWREVELDAIRALLERFPLDEHLQRLEKLCAAANGN